MAANPNPLPCGCRAITWSDDREFFHVEHCPLHLAAGEMLEALKNILLNVEHNQHIDQFYRDLISGRCRAAIKRAEGRG
jgi:hypothetical protein